MKVLVLASQKGGAGKTTLSGHLAVEAERRGFGPIALIDTDPQRGLTGWWKARPGDTLPMIAVLPEGLAATLDALREAGIALVVIDTPPAITGSIRDTVQQADLVVVPAKPSPHDLRAVAATVDIVEGAGKPMVFAINQATQRAKITAEAIMSLSQHGTIAPVTIHHRVDFATSMTDGRVVAEMDKPSKSADEIAQLWTYLQERLERMDRVPATYAA